MAVVVKGGNFDSQFFLAGPLYIVDVNFLKIQMVLVIGFNILTEKFITSWFLVENVFLQYRHVKIMASFT